MAEFCLDCYNRIYRDNLTEYDVVLTKDYDLCEGCGKCKRVVIKYRSNFSKTIIKLLKNCTKSSKSL